LLLFYFTIANYYQKVPILPILNSVLQTDLPDFSANAVDEITQFEVVCTVEKISEHYLIPVLEQLLDIFPFVIKGFHSDNGSEYINRQVAKLLENS